MAEKVATTSMHFKLLASTLVHSFCATFTVGYHISVINNPQNVFENFIESSYEKHYGKEISSTTRSALWAFVVAIYNIGGVVGAFVSMYLAEKFGRKTSLMLINNLITIVGSICSAVAKPAESFELLILGRWIVGVSGGIMTGILPLYLSECSPLAYRGLICSFENMFIQLWASIATVVSLEEVLGTENGWPYLLCAGVIPALIQILIIPFSPETPKFLYLEKDDSSAAMKSAKFYYGNSMNLDEVVAEFKQEKDLASKPIGLFAALKEYRFRFPIIISCAINLAAMSSGIIAIFSYSTEIFEEAGFHNRSAEYATLVMSGFNFFGAFAVLPLIDRVDRRPLILITLTVMIVCCCVFVIFTRIQKVVNGQWSSYLSVAAIAVHVTAFNLGAGPISYFASSELMPQNVRSVGASASLAVNWIASVMVTDIFLPVQEAVNTYSFFLFIIPTTLVTIYLYIRMPETRNRSIETIMEAWDGTNATVHENRSIDSADDNSAKSVLTRF